MKTKLDKIMEELKNDLQNPSRNCKFIGGPWHGKEYLIPNKHETIKVPHKVDGKYQVAVYIRQASSEDIFSGNRFIYHYTE